MPQPSPRIDRRRFIVYSSACALAPSVMAASASDKVELASQESLAMGYWQGTQGLGPSADAERLLDGAACRAVGPLEVVPAEDLAAADASLRRTDAVVTVHGLLGEVEDLSSLGIRSAALQIHFRCLGADVPETLKFHAWSVDGGPLPRVSNAVEFRVPIDAWGLGLSLDLDHTATASNRVRRIVFGRSTREFTGQLGVGGERHQPKLRQGFYFIPLRQETFQVSAAVSELEVGTEPCVLLSVKAA